jgi:hypothetical protein
VAMRRRESRGAKAQSVVLVDVRAEARTYLRGEGRGKGKGRGKGGYK